MRRGPLQLAIVVLLPALSALGEVWAVGATPTVTPTSAPTRAGPPEGQVVPVTDRGIFTDLTPRVRLFRPTWLADSPAITVRYLGAGTRFTYIDGVPLAFGPVDAASPQVPVAGAPADDRDRDGIPDQLDLLIGAKKAALNGAVYRSRYRRLAYPGGDVPRGEGVCTDVVVRALRNAGYDLQRALQQDIRRAPRAYPMVTRPDPSIDHRRVRTLLPLFKRRWKALSIDDSSPGASPLLPGDVVFMNTMGDARPDHIGIISDRSGSSGRPLVINNWTNGYTTSEMDLLGFVPVTHRFRLPAPRLRAGQAELGIAGLLRRRGVSVGAEHRQALLISAPGWNRSTATLQRFERRAGRWQPVGRPVPALLGRNGMARGRGLHGPAALRDAPAKREGDGRSPAGVFRIGTAFGAGATAPYAPARWPWRHADARDVWIDDPSSRHYNTWQRAPTGRAPWTSAEKLASYRLALVIEHNSGPVVAGAGSAIFLHLDSGNPTAGCATIKRDPMIEILRWLDPQAKPVVIQLPGTLL